MGKFAICKISVREARARGVLWSLAIVTPFALSGCVGSTVTSLRQLADLKKQVEGQQIIPTSSDVTAGDITLLPPDEALLKEVLSQPRSILTNMKPVKTGVGLVVCEPVVAGADKSTQQFSAGCGRWLHLNIAGLPQFGKTPSWFAFDYALRQMNKKDGQVNPQEADKLAQLLAVTHVAIGVLTGSPERSTLTYRLWKMPENKPVGTSITISGNRTEITSRLPIIAKNIAGRLDGNISLISAKTELSAQEIASIGSTPRFSFLPFDDASANTLKMLSSRSPLAGIEYISHLSALAEEDDDAGAIQNEIKATRILLQQSPQNTLVLAQASLVAPTVLDDSKNRKLFSAGFPGSYLINYAEINWHSQNKRRPEQREAVERAIACVPGSAWAWLQLQAVLSDEADDVRNARYFGEMKKSEQAFVSAIYPQAVQASLQAVRADSLNAEAWLSLSRKAAFNSDDELADAAFWKAMSLPTHDDSVYLWGLQLYQPKWQGDIGKLQRVARIAFHDEARFVRLHWKIKQAFRDAGRDSEARQFDALSVTALTQWLAKHPQDSERRADLGDLLRDRNDYQRAAKQYEMVIRQQPKDDDGYYGLALVKEHEQDWDGALKNHLQAIALDPENNAALFRAGQVYHQKRQFRQAEVLYKKSIALNSEYADPYNRLADLHVFVKNDLPAAEKLYRKAIALEPDDELFRKNLEQCLARMSN